MQDVDMHFSFETYVTFSKYKTISYLVFLIMFTFYLAMEMSCSFHFRLDLYRQTVEFRSVLIHYAK